MAAWVKPTTMREVVGGPSQVLPEIKPAIGDLNTYRIPGGELIYVYVYNMVKQHTH